ncbi:Epidermal retinol dehydrogenase 2-like, partial [Globisporangium splendens]
MFAWLFGADKSVHGQVVLVTGGAMGLGRLLSLKFARLGGIVVVWDLQAEAGEALVRDIQSECGIKAYFYRVDVTDRECVYKVGAELLEKFGAVDILVNNAGIMGGRPLLETDDRTIEKQMAVNATAHFWTIKAFLPAMMARDRGHIVSIASATGILGSGLGLVDYSTSKFASVGLMTSLKQELADLGIKGVHLTLICPSYMKTDMVTGVTLPKGLRWLMPEYVAEQVVKATLRNKWRVLLPGYIGFLEVFALLVPESWSEFIRRVVGAKESMTGQLQIHDKISSSQCRAARIKSGVATVGAMSIRGHHEYSVDRIFALHEYRQSAPQWCVVFVLVFYCAPALVLLAILDAISLGEAWSSNIVF